MNNNNKRKEIIEQYSNSINNNKKSAITHSKIPSTNTNSDLTTNLKHQASTNSYLYNKNNDYTKNSNNPNINNKVKNSNQDLINRLKNKSSALKFSITSKNYYINIKNQNVNSFKLEEEPYDKNKKKIKGNQAYIIKGINIISKFDTFAHEVKYMQKDKNQFNKTTFNYYFDKKQNLKNTKSYDINKNYNKDKKQFFIYQGKNEEKQGIICVDKSELIGRNSEINNITNKENDKNKMNIISTTKGQNEVNIISNKENIVEDTCQNNIKNKTKKEVIKSKDKVIKEKEKETKIKGLKETPIISDIKENINPNINDNNNNNKNKIENNILEKKKEKETKKDENIKKESESEKEKSQESEKNKNTEPEKPKIITKNDKNNEIEIEKKDKKEEINKEKEEKEENENKNELKKENEKKEEKNEKKVEKKEENKENKENKDESNKIKKEEEIKYNSPVKKNKTKKKKKTRDYSSTPIIIQYKPLSPQNNIEKSDPEDLLPKYFTTSSITSITNAQIPKDYLNIIYYNLLIEEKENRKFFKSEYNYMNNQKEINEQMRSILVDWIIDVHGKFGFCDETLYMTVSIIDRYSSIKK